MADLLARIAVDFLSLSIVAGGLWVIVVSSIKGSARRKAAKTARLMRGEAR